MRSGASLVLLLALPACAVESGGESPHSDLGGTTRTVCSVAPLHHHGPGVALDFDSQTYLVLPDIWTRDGHLIPSGGATFPGPDELCETGLTYVEQDGNPIEVLPRTEEERSIADKTEGAERIALWPTSGFVHEGGGFVFYEKLLVRGYFDIEPLGVGVARISAGGVAERLTPGEEELFAPGRFRWGSGSVLGRDGFAYVYGCDSSDAFSQPCAVARVSPRDIGDRAAYEYLDGSGNWSRDPDDAAPTFEGAGSISTLWNPHLGRFLMVSAPTFSTELMARSPAAPFGPFDRPLEPHSLFVGKTASDFGLGNVQQLGAEGRHVFVLYSDGAELQVVEHTLP